MRRDFQSVYSYVATANLPKYRLVAAGATDRVAVLATSPTSSLPLGVTTDVDTDYAAGENRVDVVRGGVAPVTYGATIAFGQAVTTNSEGKAVPAAQGQQIYGFAEEAGGAGDIGSIFVQPIYFAP